VLAGAVPGRVSGTVGWIAANVRGGFIWYFSHSGMAPTHFPTLLTRVLHGPPSVATCPNTLPVGADEWLRTGVYETQIESPPGPAAWRAWRQPGGGQ
jgi:hypothetical protein